MACPFDPQYVGLFSGFVIAQIGIFLVYLGLYFLASYKQILMKIPAERFFRIKFDSLTHTIIIPVTAGILLSLGFLFLRPVFAPSEPPPTALPLSILLIFSVVMAPVLESIATQGLVFLIALSAFMTNKNKKSEQSSVFSPSKEALVFALIIQGAVFGLGHFNDFTGFFAFKMIYTAIDGLVLGYICWSNNRNLLPVMLCHMAFNITAILYQPYILC